MIKKRKKLKQKNHFEDLTRLHKHFPLLWVKILAFKLLEIKLSCSTGVLDHRIDSDFVEIGNNVILGEGYIIMSSINQSI